MASPEGRHAQRREQSMERLRQAAVDLFRTRSYAAIRIEDIAARAGMAKGSLYMYFKGKDELYLQVFDLFFTKLFSEEFSRFSAIDDPRIALRAMIGFAVNQTSLNDEIMFIYRAVMDPSLMELVRSRMDRYMAEYFGIIEALFTRLGRAELKEQCYLLAVLLDGLWFYRIMEMEPAEFSTSRTRREALKQTLYEMFDL